MKSKYPLLLAVLTLVVLLTGVYQAYRTGSFGKHTPHPLQLGRKGDIRRIELHSAQHSLILVRNSDSSDSGWSAQSSEGATIASLRINRKQVSKVLDLLGAIARIELSQTTLLPFDDASHFGCSTPRLRLLVSWSQPSPGSESYDFCNNDRSNGKTHLVLPEVKRFVLAPNQLTQYFEQGGWDLLLDKRLSTFDTDDVEALESEGLCRKLKIYRDGDRWRVDAGGLSTGVINEYLDSITTLRGTGEESTENETNAVVAPWCTLKFTGRSGRSEMLMITAHKTDRGQAIVSSSAYSGRPTVNWASLKMLAP